RAVESLSANGADWSETTFTLSLLPPTHVPEGTRVLESLEVGYRISSGSQGFKFILPIAYAVVAGNGQVLEARLGSDEAIRELKAHLFGRDLTKVDLATIARLNRQLLEDLRSDPALTAKLKQFAHDRGWPEGLENDTLLAYWAEEPGLKDRLLR